MKKNLLIILLLHLSSIAQTTPVQPLSKLFTELDNLTPLKRMVRTSKYLDTLVSNRVPFPKITKRIDSLLVYSQKVKDPELAGYLHFYDQIKKGLHTATDQEIVKVFNEAIIYFKGRENFKYAGISHYYLGQHYYEKHKYGDAFYHHVQAQKLFDIVGIANIIDVGKYLHVMALNYYHFGYYDNVIALMRASITVPAFNENLDMQRYNTLGMAYKKLEKLDSAIYYFNQTRQIATSLHDTTWISIAAGNLGSTFAKKGQYAKALPLLMQDYQHNQYQNRYPVLARNAALNIAQAWQKLNRQDSAIYYIRQSQRLTAVAKEIEPMWKEQRDEQLNMVYYEILHGYYKSQANSRMAYLYLDSLTSLRNETNLRYNKMTKQLAEDRLTIEQQLANISAQELETKRISARLQLIIAIVGLLAAIVSLLYYMLRLRQAKERLIAEREKVVHQTVQKKIEAQLAEANLELNEYISQIHEEKPLEQPLQSEINQPFSDTKQRFSHLEELTSKLVDIKLLTTDDWNDFRQRFNQACGGQLDQLKLQYGNLTIAEERIYALEKLNVSTSQMAWMLGISPESVRKTRYRLRKKIGHLEI